MDREEIIEDLNDHYSKNVFSTLASYMGLRGFEKLNKPELLVLVVDNLYIKERFLYLYNKLTQEAQIVIKHLTWNGISTLKYIDSIYHIKIALDDFYGNTSDPFIKQFKQYYSNEILFSNGLRELFKKNIRNDSSCLKSESFSKDNIVLTDNLVIENLDGISEFINLHDVKARGFDRNLLVKTLNKFSSLYNFTEPIGHLRKIFILRFLSYMDSMENPLERLSKVVKSYMNGILIDSDNIDLYLYYPFVKGIKSNHNIDIFLKRGRYSFLNKIRTLNGWISTTSLLREQSLQEDTQIFDTSYFGSLLSVKVPDEFSRNFSNKITLTYKKDSEDLLLLPMCCGIIFFLYSIGAADLVVDLENKKYGLSTLESVTHFRITELGKRLLGLKSTYKIEGKIKSSSLFHPTKKIITINGDDSSMEIFCNRIGHSIGGGHFLVTYKSFFKECNTERDFEYNIDKLTAFLGDNPPEIWVDLLSELDESINPTYNEQELLVINFPRNNTRFIDAIMDNERIRSLFLMVEGFKGAFNTKNYKIFKRLMKEEGFII